MKLRISLGLALVWSACGPDVVPLDSPNGRYVLELNDHSAFEASSPITVSEDLQPKEQLQSAFPRLRVIDALDQLPTMLIVEPGDAEELTRLMTDSRVAHVWPDELKQMSDVESFAFIGQSAALDAGVRGTGATVAVLDTGLNYLQGAFGNCAVVGAAGCSVAAVRDFAVDDKALDDNGHGTNVAGIIIGEAPSARVIGLDVFTGGGAYSTDIISAINWVIANRATYNIVAMNLSLGGGGSSTLCPIDAFATPIAAARTAGVLSAIAAGNDAQSTKLSSPACVPDAISVGALYDANVGGLRYGNCADTTTAAGKVACFSNSTAFMSMWAPGALITAAGYTMAGTSQATPHVAGALALVASKFPNDKVDQRASRLLSGAPTVVDARNGSTRPSLSLPAALRGCVVSVANAAPGFTSGASTVTLAVTAPAGCTWSLVGLPTWLTAAPAAGTGNGSVVLSATANLDVARTARFPLAGVMISASQAADTTPPVGTITAPAYATSTAVTVTLSATDASGVSSMCLSTTATCTAWVPYATPKAVTLAAGDGAKSISVWFKDARGNASATPVSATVKLDTTPPVNGRVVVTASGTRATVSWSGFSDLNGIAKYRLVVSTTTADPVAGCTGTPAYEGTALTAPVIAPSKSVRRFRVCAVDVAGNVSAGALATITMP